MITNHKNNETRSQSSSEIIEAQFKGFDGILVQQTGIDTYEIGGEDMYAYLYHCNDGKWLLNIDELTVNSPTKLKSISSAFVKVLKNLNKQHSMA